jgi:hypothetical protein
MIEHSLRYKPEVCPTCNHKYSMKPPLEYKLFCLQEKYFKNRNDRAVANQFFTVIAKYTYRLLLKKIKGKLSLDKRIVTDKVFYTTAKLFGYYNKPFFVIENSFAGYINWVLLDALYNHKRRRDEDHDSLNDLLKDGKSEVLDNLVAIGYCTIVDTHRDAEIEVLAKNKFVIHKIIDIIDTMSELLKSMEDYETYYLFLLGMYFFLNKENDIFMNKYYAHVGTDITLYIKKTIGIIYERLRNSEYY